MPGKVPSSRNLLFGCGRESVVSEIDVFEIGSHVECEVVRLRDSIPQFVTPAIQSLRAIGNMEDG